MELLIHPPGLLANSHDESCLENVQLSFENRIIFLFGGTIVLVATFFLILGSIRFRELRKQPGDLICFIAIFDFLLAAHWISLALPETIDKDGSLCFYSGVIGTLSGINEYVYNVAFSAYLVISMRNALKQDKIPKKTFHVIAFVVSVVGLTFFIKTDKIGKTLAGTCSIKSSCGDTRMASFLGPAIAFSYAIIGFFTLRYIKNNAPKCSTAHSKRTQFILYYSTYVQMASLIFIVIALLNALSFIFTSRTVGFDQGKEIVNLLFNVSKLCSPLVLSFIRYNDPLIKKIMKKTIFFWRQESQKPLEKGLIEGDSEANITVSEPERDEDEFVFNQLNAERRTEIVYTLLSCILYADFAHKNNVKVDTIERNAKNPYKHRKMYLIDDSLKEHLPNVKKPLDENKVSILPGTLKVYAPEIFMRFINDDSNYLNIQESLDFILNKEEIADASGPGGGKSGEFFFFSKDKKLIIKTIPDVEMTQVGKILKDYEQHMKENPNTLIAKLYGAFTFSSTEFAQKFNLIIMKNINGFPSKYVERIYDMKGSRYDREVIKSKNPLEKKDLKSFGVMKDLDFERFEKKIYIQGDYKAEFLRQIDLDSSFFRKVKLIDYSFMVFCVNKTKYIEDHGQLNDGFTAKNHLGSFANTEEQGMYYNVGIVDYLQPYNLQKKMEKCLKKITKANLNLDTSSQDPKYYSARFIDFIRKIVE